MAGDFKIEFDEAGWDQVLTEVVEVWARPMADRIADAANRQAEAQMDAVLAQDSSTPGRRRARAIAHQDPPDGKRDYMVSTEGSNPLSQRDYRATVITVTDRAKIDNARNNTLIQFFNAAGGAE